MTEAFVKVKGRLVVDDPFKVKLFVGGVTDCGCVGWLLIGRTGVMV